jgi:hypothetical protein
MTNPRDQLDALLPPDPGAGRTEPLPAIPAGAVPADLPKHLRDRLDEAPGPDRSAQTAGLVAAAVEWGLEDGQIVALALSHRPTVEKYGKRVEREAARLIGTGVVEGQASEGEPDAFPRAHVEQLRKENADRRKRTEELVGRNARLVAGLLRAEVVADGRLADPADLLDGADPTALLDDDGAPDPEKVKAAVSELLGRKPHYAKRISGDVGQGARPGPGDPNEELWGIIQSRTRSQSS